jgi:hypothetical protein
MKARVGGELKSDRITLQNTGATVELSATSRLTAREAVIVGGLIEGPGRVEVDDWLKLQGVHLDGAAAQVGNGDVLMLDGPATNDGRIELDDNGAYGEATLRILGSVMLDGNGAIAAASGYSNRIEGDAGDDLLTLGSGQMIHAPQNTDMEIDAEVVNHGEIRADGSVVLGGNATITNAPDGRLSGSGVFDVGFGSFVNDGVTAPGSSTGVLTFDGDFAQSALGMLELEIDLTGAGWASERLAVLGSAELAGLVDVTLIDETPDRGALFEVLTATGGVTDAGLALLAEDEPSWNLHVGDDAVQIEYVPEPTTLALLAIGGVGLLRRRRR